MRVITGTARGRRLRTLEGSDVRPTTDRIKEAIFSVIHFDIEGRSMLDLFAGSGQMGIEAISRGAARVVFVDSSKESVEVVRENVIGCGMMKQSVIVQSEARMYLRHCISDGREKFDFAFLDPPYGRGILQDVLPSVVEVMKDSGAVICECPLEEELPEEVGRFCIYKTYRYGKIKITFYRIKGFDEDGGVI